MKRFIYSLLVMAVFVCCQQPGYTQSISVTNISPESPAILHLNQNAHIAFEYTSEVSGGIRIFVRPMTNGHLSPNYAASGSPLYGMGKGKGSASFTIKHGSVAVDQLRFQVYTANQNKMLFEFLIPVKWHFGQKLNATSSMVILRPGKKPKPAGSENATDTTEFRRIIRPDGTVEIHYTDGWVKSISPGGSITKYNPKTGQAMSISKMQVQPASPPEFYTSVSSSVDNNWLAGLNGWVEYVGEGLLQRIKYLVNDDASFDSYQRFEDANTKNLYEKVDMRLEFLERLGESDSN